MSCDPPSKLLVFFILSFICDINKDKESCSAIFGDKVDSPLDQLLKGIDRGLLHLEARFSYEKRMGKIAAIFPRTLEILQSDRDAMFRQFVETYPAVRKRVIEYPGAAHTLEFEPPGHPFVGDVLAWSDAI